MHNTYATFLSRITFRSWHNVVSASVRTIATSRFYALQSARIEYTVLTSIVFQKWYHSHALDRVSLAGSTFGARTGKSLTSLYGVDLAERVFDKIDMETRRITEDNFVAKRLKVSLRQFTRARLDQDVEHRRHRDWFLDAWRVATRICMLFCIFLLLCSASACLPSRYGVWPDALLFQQFRRAGFQEGSTSSGPSPNQSSLEENVRSHAKQNLPVETLNTLPPQLHVKHWQLTDLVQSTITTAATLLSDSGTERDAIMPADSEFQTPWRSQAGMRLARLYRVAGGRHRVTIRSLDVRQWAIGVFGIGLVGKIIACTLGA